MWNESSFKLRSNGLQQCVQGCNSMLMSTCVPKLPKSLCGSMCAATSGKNGFMFHIQTQFLAYSVQQNILYCLNHVFQNKDKLILCSCMWDFSMLRRHMWKERRMHCSLGVFWTFHVHRRSSSASNWLIAAAAARRRKGRENRLLPSNPVAIDTAMAPS